jgi:hypothetical protein
MPEIRDDLGNIENLSMHCPDLFWEREEIIKEVFIPFTNLKKFVVQQDLFWLPENDMYMLGCDREDVSKLLFRACSGRKLSVLYKEVDHESGDGSGGTTTRVHRFRSEN